MPSDKHSKPYDPVDYLKTPDDIAEYLNAAIEDGNEQLMLAVIRDIVRAMGGMSELSRETGLSRESLYRALSDDGNPKLSNFVAVLHALNLELAVRPRKRVA
jgi:probable addiction module antidote protein